MARWIWLVGFGGAASCLSGAAALLAVVVCVLAAATVAAALCAKEFKNQCKKRRDVSCLGNPKEAAESRGKGFMKTLRSKSLLLSKKWQRNERDEPEENNDFLWQKRILMGERCKPLNFSGLIMYDQKGQPLPQFPMRSPQFPMRSPKHNNTFVPSPKVDEEAN